MMLLLKRYFPLLALLLIFVYGGCTFNNEEDYFDSCNLVNNNGDTVAIYYDDLSPIFEETCANCHNSVTTRRKGIVLDSYENVKTTLTENHEKVFKAIKHTGPFKMPAKQPQLPDCDIEKIIYWFNTNMPENENN